MYTATSAEETESVLRSRKVEAVVSDEHMPGICGGVLMAWAANHRPEVMRMTVAAFPRQIPEERAPG
jgi:hypothetical protein